MSCQRDPSAGSFGRVLEDLLCIVYWCGVALLDILTVVPTYLGTYLPYLFGYGQGVPHLAVCMY